MPEKEMPEKEMPAERLEAAAINLVTAFLSAEKMALSADGREVVALAGRLAPQRGRDNN
jgi:hypothetical protein